MKSVSIAKFSPRPETSAPRFFVVHKEVIETMFLSGGEIESVKLPTLLAFSCVINRQSLDEYVILAIAKDVNDLRKQTQEVIDVGSELQRKIKAAIKLTKREQAVLHFVAEFKSNKEIASELNISERTVKFHVSSLLMKFHVSGRSELAQSNAIWKNSTRGQEWTKKAKSV